MPNQATIAITPGSGQFLDAVSVVIGGNTVVRETMVIADPTSPTSLAGVSIVGSLFVAGRDAVLNTPTDNPFVIAGVDGSNNIQFFPVNGAGGVQAGTKTVLVGGVGGGNDANFLPVSLEGSSSAPSLVNIGGIYHTTQPTYTNGQGAQAQSTARGALIVAPGIEPFAVTITGIAVKAASTAALATDPALVVTTNGSTTAGAPANTSVTSTSSAILAANTARREVMITNTDVVAVYIAFGQTPTATAYHVVLRPCAIAHDGSGGTFVSDIFKGAINAIVASTAGHISVVELT